MSSKYYTPPLKPADGDTAYVEQINTETDKTNAGFELVETDVNNATALAIAASDYADAASASADAAAASAAAAAASVSTANTLVAGDNMELATVAASGGGSTNTFSTPSYICSALTGGAAGALDATNYANLGTLHVAHTYIAGSKTQYTHYYDPTDTSVENSPSVIKCDDLIAASGASGAGSWLEVTTVGASATGMTAMVTGKTMEGAIAGLDYNMGTPSGSSFSVSIGSCMNSSNEEEMKLATAIDSKSTGASWSAGASGGALLNYVSGQALTNSSIYEVYLIKTSGGTLDAGLLYYGDDIAAEIAHASVNYDYFRWLGYVLTDSSGVLIPWYHAGMSLIWDKIIIFASSVNTSSLTAQSVGNVVPSGGRVQAIHLGNPDSITNFSYSVGGTVVHTNSNNSASEWTGGGGAAPTMVMWHDGSQVFVDTQGINADLTIKQVLLRR